MTSPRPFDDPRNADTAGLLLLLIALAVVTLFHGGLLPFTHGRTYDAFIHMFFGDSYHRSWFDPWEPRWYTGFATTAYPPGTHMAIAALMKLMPLRAAFVVVQMVGLLVLTVGVFRFSLLWVAPRSAGLAALSLALSSSVTETVHLFGQLPTIVSLGIFLNGMPYVYRWIVGGGMANLVAAVIFAGATTAAHHVTTIFGSVLFVIPLGIQALRSVVELRIGLGRRAITGAVAGAVGRGALLAGLFLGVMILTVFPYWSWSVADPITQVSIPHGSRESFVERPDLGLVFFVLPWGTAIIALPYVVYKTVSTRLWPLGGSVLLCFVLGTGGTTPVPRMLLGGAFDILTLDRFTFWATILCLPFLGLMLDGLLWGRSGNSLRLVLGRGVYRLLVGGFFAATTLVAVFIATLTTIRPTQPEFVDPTPIVNFMAEDEHHRWRYLTLGFGDQFAYLSALTPALSVDGNYHSARRLPDLTNYSIERLENAKYMGVPGLGSLRQFLENAESYHLKFVFSNDAFYDPLLHFTGWTRLTRLQNGITVWERPDVSPLPLTLPRRALSSVHQVMWGVLPPLMLVLAAGVFAVALARRGLALRGLDPRPVPVLYDGFTNPRRVRRVVVGLGAAMALLVIAGMVMLAQARARVPGPEQVIAAYFDDLDFRRFQDAYDRLDPETRPGFQDVLFGWRWRGGLIASYGKLQDIRVTPLDEGEALRDFRVELDWLTALSVVPEVLDIRMVARDGRWYVVPTQLRPTQAPERLQRQVGIDWNATGRRQPRPEADIHRDRMDRPRIALDGMRLVSRGGRFHLVGQLTNADADPAHVSLWGTMLGGARALATQAAGDVIAHRLLPAETTGLRVDFQGVLSLDDAALAGSFDPVLYLPPSLPVPPDAATVEARALVQGADLYHGVTLTSVVVTEGPDGITLQGRALNAGSESVSVARVIALLYDDTGAPIWAEAGYVTDNMAPGQGAVFRLSLPRRDEITVIAPVRQAATIVNGSQQQADIALPGAADGTLALSIPGYSALRLQVSAMTYDPLF